MIAWNIEVNTCGYWDNQNWVWLSFTQMWNNNKKTNVSVCPSRDLCLVRYPFKPHYDFRYGSTTARPFVCFLISSSQHHAARFLSFYRRQKWASERLHSLSGFTQLADAWPAFCLVQWLIIFCTVEQLLPSGYVAFAHIFPTPRCVFCTEHTAEAYGLYHVGTVP